MKILIAFCKRNFKRIVVLTAVVIALFLIIRWIVAYHNRSVTTPIGTEQPKDSNFVAVHEETFTPQSVPLLERKKNDPVKLPKYVKQSNIASIDIVVTTNHKTGKKDTTSIIRTKEGDVFVPKKDSSKTVEVQHIEYLPPILDFDLFPKLGIDAMSGNISPVAGLGLLKICGVVALPVLFLDLQGPGIGADVNIYRQWTIGAMYHVDWQFNKSIRIPLCYNFL